MIDLRERIAAARAIVVLTGSGISAESGLPTFRGSGGLWRTHRVEELASAAGFTRDPQLVWTWYNERRQVHRAATPSASHRALARLEAVYPNLILVTQNVDSLHLRAGSRNVLELHGQLREARCTLCAQRRSLDDPLPPNEIAHGCGGQWRPDIVWFGEPLPPAVWQAAVAAAARADLMLVVGTSGLVQPAAALATRRYAPQAYIVEINPEPTVLSERVDTSIRALAGDVLPHLFGEAWVADG